MYSHTLCFAAFILFIVTVHSDDPKLTDALPEWDKLSSDQQEHLKKSCTALKNGEKEDGNNAPNKILGLFGLKLASTEVCEKYNYGDPGMGGGAIAGIVIGVILVIAIIIGGVWYFKKKNN